LGLGLRVGLSLTHVDAAPIRGAGDVARLQGRVETQVVSEVGAEDDQQRGAIGVV